MSPVRPESAEDLADYLQQASLGHQSITVTGNNSKRLMAGPILCSDCVVSTSRLRRILQYEPNDLTISVEAGLPWPALQSTLARQGQMVALDPPFFEQSTVGGVVASNLSGPFRRAFGTARDLVIGLRFATLEGQLISAGGMVVKNVAGLDFGKLLIGSFGTLAVLTSVNFRLHALPEQTCTFLFSFSELDAAIQKRDSILASVLRPMAIELMSPVATARIDRKGYLLAIRAGGSRTVLTRFARELPGSEQISGADEERWWQQVREFPADFLRRQPGGIILKVSAPISGLHSLLRLCTDACIARAGSGVAYLYQTSWPRAHALLQKLIQNGWTATVEYAPDEIRQKQPLWFAPANETDAAFDMMKKIKQTFDPNGLLNRSRVYGRL